jgi:hypothetical protein
VVNAAANVLPLVAITSPTTNSTYNAIATITIEVSASDADGQVSKIEFYNGMVKIGEDLSAPYSLIWTNVLDGIYTITAVATDNVNGVKTSTPITINVSKLTVVANNLSETNYFYPNPSSGIVHFGIGAKNVQIMTLDGVVMPVSYAPVDDFIDLSRLQNGIYVISFERNGKVYYEKITKQ